MSALSQKNNDHLNRGTARLPWRSLTWQFLFITILPLTVLVLVVAFGSLAVHQNAMRSLVGDRDERYVRTAGAALDEQLQHRLLALRSLAVQLDQSNDEQIDAVLADSQFLLEEFAAGLAILDPQGDLISTLGDDQVWTELAGQVGAALQDWQSASDSTTYFFSNLNHPHTGEPLILMVAASPDGKLIAAGMDSANGFVRHTLANVFDSHNETTVVVYDRDKQLIYGSGTLASTTEASDHPGIAEALRGESGTTYVEVDGSEHVVAYTPIPALGWALVMEEPWEMVASPTLRASQMAPLVLVPVLILSLVAFWFAARQIVRPLQTLESRAATLARGDFKSIETPVGGIEEIRQLQDELVSMARKVQASQKSLHGYIGAITAAQEDERRRLARELHDDTIQALIALKQRVQLTQLGLSNDKRSEQEAAALQEIASLTEQTIENLRRLTRALRPIYLEDLGLVTALEMLARETGQAMDIPVEFQKQGVEIRLDPSIELALYRIAQEALNNIARHAGAKKASLYVQFSPGAVTMEIHDNGKGFEVPKSQAEYAPSGHFGLLGLYERAELIGAALEIRSTPGQGSHLSIRLPLLSL
jgi:two-component system sensor histidine kinase UhpB